MNNILILELIIGVIISFTMIGILIWSIKKKHFDDSQYLMNGVLFDSEDDLNDFIKKDKKSLKHKKINKN